MERVDIPRERLRRYQAAAEESSIARQQAIAEEAWADARQLFAAGDAVWAGGAVMVVLGATLLRAAARTGREGEVGRPAEPHRRAGGGRHGAGRRRVRARLPGGPVRVAASGRTALTAGSDAAPARRGIAVPLRGEAWPPVGVQAGRLGADLDAHRRLAAAGHPLARGAALAAAHAALRLAATPAVTEADRRLRRAALDVAVPALAAAGLPHVGELVSAALLHDRDPAAVARGVERPQ